MTSQSTVKPKRVSPVFVAAIGIAIVVVLGGALGCKRRAPSATSRNDGLTETYASKNGLVIAHYPATFAAKTAGKSVIILSRHLSHQTEEVLSFVSIEKPISDELKEVSRVMLAAEAPTMKGYQTTSTQPATCHGNPGIETIGTWLSDGVPFSRNECVFLHGGHAYSFAWNVTSSIAAEEEASLRTIREAAELTP